MFSQTATEEVFEGGRLRSYFKSYFLDCVPAATWAKENLPDDLLHYQLSEKKERQRPGDDDPEGCLHDALWQVPELRAGCPQYLAGNGDFT